MKLPEDPVMLLSFVNTKLRDQYASLDALCDDLDAPRAALEARLGLGHFELELVKAEQRLKRLILSDAVGKRRGH